MGYMGTFIVIELHLQIPRELSTTNRPQHCKEITGMCVSLCLQLRTFNLSFALLLHQFVLNSIFLSKYSKLLQLEVLEGLLV